MGLACGPFRAIALLTADNLTCDTTRVISRASAAFVSGWPVHLLPDWSGSAREIYMAWPSVRLLSARAKAMRDEMERFIRLTPELQGEIPGLRWAATKCSNL